MFGNDAVNNDSGMQPTAGVVHPTDPAMTPSQPVTTAPALPQVQSPVVDPLADFDSPSDNLGYAKVDDSQSNASQASIPSDVTNDPAPQQGTQVQVSHDDHLLNLKQQALSQLGPLVDHLDQSPEEKFRTTMMMIQATDDKNLLQSAYDAANAIPDDKAKAQALLDVVNEINYFHQKGQQA